MPIRLSSDAHSTPVRPVYKNVKPPGAFCFLIQLASNKRSLFPNVHLSQEQFFSFKTFFRNGSRSGDFVKLRFARPSCAAPPLLHSFLRSLQQRAPFPPPIAAATKP